MIKYLELEDQQEALHIANLMASHGYFFPIEDHVLTYETLVFLIFHFNFLLVYKN